MENKNLYQSLLRGKVTSAIAQARAAADMTHQGVKGSVLEILLSKLFRPLLPADIGVGTGQIIDAFGNPPSPQVDIVIYNKAILPPVLVDDNTGIFPIESVLYTIEVKTTLNSRELSGAEASAKIINNTFKYLPGKLDADGKRIHHPISKPRAVVFALNTDLRKNGITEAERYKKIYKNETHYINAICVAGREYSYEAEEHWISMRNEDGFNEVLGLIAGITNTYREVSDSRGYPLLGHYIAPENIETILLPAIDLPELKVKCAKCGKEMKTTPTFDGFENLTINGAITCSFLCDCGGKLTSEKGTYIIKKGRLREINPFIEQGEIKSED